MKKQSQRPSVERVQAPRPEVLAPEQLREVIGGGDIQARAFGAGKYGVETP